MKKLTNVLANPYNVIIVFAIITVFGIGITISFINYNFQQNQMTQKGIEQTQKVLINLTQEIHDSNVIDDVKIKALLHQILNRTH